MPYDKSQVKDAPSIDPDGSLSRSEEEQLYRHYGLDYGEVPTDSGREADEGMTRSEEELRVGTQERETGRVRLRKHIVTDARRGAGRREKRTVPKERVRLGKDVEVDERTVSEDVRREEIDVDDRRDR